MMDNNSKFKWRARSYSAVLSVAILISCAGLLLTSCGKAPMEKVTIVDAGANAVYSPNTIETYHGDPTETITSAVVALSLDPTDTVEPGGFDYKETSFTIEMWIKPELFGRDQSPTKPFSDLAMGTLIAGGNTDYDQTKGFALYLWDGDDGGGNDTTGCKRTATAGGERCVKFTIKRNHSAALWYVASARADLVTDGEWHHVAAVFDNDDFSMTIYIDGVPIPGADASHTNPTTAGSAVKETGPTFMLQNHAWASGNSLVGGAAELWPYKGTVDETRLWTVARTQEEIQRCMFTELNLVGGSCAIEQPGLATYYSFNEGGGISVYDKSGNGNDGTLLSYWGSSVIAPPDNEDLVDWDNPIWVNGASF